MHQIIPYAMFLLGLSIAFLGGNIDLSVWLIIGCFIYIGLYKVFDFSSKVKSAIVQKSKEESMPIYTSLDIGKSYIELGKINAGNSFEPKAKVDFIKKAEKLGADAIVGVKGELTTSSSAKIDKGIMNIGNDPKYYSVKQEENSYYEYSGIAIKFNDLNQKTNVNVEKQENKIINVEKQENIYEDNINKLLILKNNAPEYIANLENDLVLEIDKQKKLLENGIIDNDEYENRITISKNKLLEEKKFFNGLDSSIEKMLLLKELEDENLKTKESENEATIKEFENEATIKIEKQKKYLSMNLIDKKEYDKEINLIQMELEEKKRKDK